MLPPAILKTTFVNRPTSFRPMDADWNNKIHDRFWWIIDVWHEWKGLQLKFYSKIRISDCQRNCSTRWQIYTFQVIKTYNFHNFWYYFIKLKYHASLSNISGELSTFDVVSQIWRCCNIANCYSFKISIFKASEFFGIIGKIIVRL